MGLITTLIGNYSRSKMEEQAQKTSEINQRIQANQSILKDPTATPEAKQYAQTDITRLLYQHGGPEGKKHAPTIGTILGTLAGTMGEVAGVPRKQQAPAAPGAPPRLYKTEDELAAERKKQYTEETGLQVDRTKAVEKAKEEIQDAHDEGNLVKARARLESIKNIIPPEEYTRLRAELETGLTLPAGAAPKATTVELNDGTVISAWESARPGQFETLDHRPIDPKTIRAVGVPIEPKMSGELGQLTQARRTLVDPKASKEEKEAAQNYIDKQTREPTAVTTQKEAGEEADQIAEGIVRGDLPPDLTGLARGGIAAKVEAKLSKQGYNLAQAKNDWRGVQRWITTLNSNQQVRLQQAADFALESLDVLDNPKAPGDDLIGQLRAKVPRTKYPVLNRAAIAAAKGGAFGDDAANIATQVDSQITDLQSEIAVVYKGGGSPTDKGLEQSQKILSSDWSDKTLRGAIGLARRNLGLRLNSVRNVGPQGLSPAGQERYAPQPTGPPAGGGGGDTGGKVKMRAPNGQIWEAPADQVEHYRQQGATVVK